MVISFSIQSNVTCFHIYDYINFNGYTYLAICHHCWYILGCSYLMLVALVIKFNIFVHFCRYCILHSIWVSSPHNMSLLFINPHIVQSILYLLYIGDMQVSYLLIDYDNSSNTCRPKYPILIFTLDTLIASSLQDMKA